MAVADEAATESDPELDFVPGPGPALTGRLGTADADGELDLTLVPYYAWANRGADPMRVWIPTI